MQNLRNKILQKRAKTITEDDIIDIHDVFMVEYGWIPLEEFRNLPIPTLFNLVNRIKKRKEKEEKAMKKKGR